MNGGDLDLTVDGDDRLDRFVARAVPHLSRRHLHTLIASGQVRVNGRRARKGDALRRGDRVRIAADAISTMTPLPQPDLPVAVLATGDGWVAVDKPAGMPSVAQRATDRDTVSNFLAGRFPETVGHAAGRGIECGVAHRLDTATSGVLLAARNSGAYDSLRQQFASGLVRKQYRAVVAGEIGDGGEIALALRSKPGERARVEVAAADARGARRAVTTWRRLATAGGCSELEIEIRTGVRHQIRAHLAAAGHPIIGDTMYGGRPAARLYLHAAEISFTSPAEQRAVTVASPLPDAFRVIGRSS